MERRAATLILIGGVYAASGELGLLFAFENASASPVWPPTGIAIASLVLVGRWAWPAITVGALAYNLLTTGDLASSALIAMGNTLEAVAGAALLLRGRSVDGLLQGPRDVLRFTALGGLAPALLSATTGVTALALRDLVVVDDAFRVWATWWVGDVAGAVLIAPPILLTAAAFRRDVWPPLAETFVSLSAIAVLAGWTFTSVEGSSIPISVGLVAPLLLLVWPITRLGPLVTSVAMVGIAAASVWGTVRGMGPFVLATENDSLVFLQMVLVPLTVLALAAATWAARRELGGSRGPRRHPARDRGT